ncbi:MAG: Do family serine endopeptidase [Candidatus Marinimicrobia bacterium]|jgi:serine protease Do|nr:Do family serine endopeptidase [Candidatus Neomarinimicrobiota bacterium]MBT3946181.1 Do family serine endopeptidase [Candidatus Neomarinimicrobiota bacterium]MBT4155399.1 Do family serine endopeptidase [Candidatus Neomarinimicrobiota bacterium]MBT4753525.1 Do family serine endopeptidase [Candidatus Neomarinimicrobiota bacterium]MBT5114543.1 Do family serine endopeptidase [Candidatus Neomarinimicrobiota bacterium]|tara:strand:+ start:10265 stop:11644 length:1380 start_codon:yes stop_codon:yes gene_type:complete
MKRIILISLLYLSVIFPQNSIVKQFSKAFADVAEKAKPAVVTIITDKVISVDDMDNFGYFFFHQNQPRRKEFKTKALGSGVIIDAENGYILTNNHVVADTDGIHVRLIDKREFEATLIGSDPKSDLAVLQIETDGLKEIQLGNSDKIRVGEWVMAVGSPFSENLSHTVTTGIISALGRSNIMNSQSYEDFIQTDAAINPGNSGGALLNMDGELIGINTAIATGGVQRGSQGVGFAIPSNMANRIMSDLIQHGYVTRSWLGVFIDELDYETAEHLNIETPNGALITDVVEESPAKLGGIQEGDVIVEFDGEPIANPANLKNIVSLTAPNSISKVKIIRDGSPIIMKVVLKELPKNPRQFATRQQSEFDEFGFNLKKTSSILKKKYDLSKDNGLVVTRIDPNGEAYEKGIREGDIIKRVGTEKVRSVSEFSKLANLSQNKGAILVLVKKPNGKSRFFTLNY